MVAAVSDGQQKRGQSRPAVLVVAGACVCHMQVSRIAARLVIPWDPPAASVHGLLGPARAGQAESRFLPRYPTLCRCLSRWCRYVRQLFADRCALNVGWNSDQRLGSHGAREASGAAPGRCICII